MAVTLADALTDFALLAVEGQQALFDEAGAAEWRADLDQRRLWLGERVYEVAMVGTSSEISNTWMWSWANPGYGTSHPAVSAILPGVRKGTRGRHPGVLHGILLPGGRDGLRHETGIGRGLPRRTTVGRTRHLRSSVQQRGGLPGGPRPQPAGTRPRKLCRD